MSRTNHPVSLMMARLARAFPRETLTPERVALYTEMLADIPDPILAQAADTLILTAKFFPAISEIREQAAELTVSLPSEDQALEQVQARIDWARDGGGGTPPDVHPIARLVVEEVGGWYALRSSGIADVARAQFVKSYRARRARRIKALQVGRFQAALPAGDTPRAMLPDT